MRNDHPDRAGSKQDRPHASVGRFKVSFICFWCEGGSKYGKWQGPLLYSISYKVPKFNFFVVRGVCNMGNGKDRLKDRKFISPLFQSKFQILFVVVRGSKYGKLQCPQSHLGDFYAKLT